MPSGCLKLIGKNSWAVHPAFAGWVSIGKPRYGTLGSGPAAAGPLPKGARGFGWGAGVPFRMIVISSRARARIPVKRRSPEQARSHDH
jgi:hypothetical protein